MENVFIAETGLDTGFLTLETLKKIADTDEIELVTTEALALQLINDCFQGMRSMPDIIFLDPHMSGIDGFSFIEAFRKLNLLESKKVKIIIIPSPFASLDTVQKAKRIGRHSVQVESISPAMLLEITMTALHKSHNKMAGVLNN